MSIVLGFVLGFSLVLGVFLFFWWFVGVVKGFGLGRAGSSY